MAAASNYSIVEASAKFGLRRSTTPSYSRFSDRRSVRMQVSLHGNGNTTNNRNFSLRNSEEAFNLSMDLMPGGVNSPVRAFKSVGGQPIVIDSVKGSRMWDIDGNEYIDYVGSWGPAIIGHAHDKILLFTLLSPMDISKSSLIYIFLRNRSMHGGTPLGPCFYRKTENHQFEGCYHGHADPFLVQAAPYNDFLAIEKLFEKHKGDIAAVILDTCLPFSSLDEVMTGFRLSYGGAQEYFGIIPDLTTLGKIWWSLPVGAYGGKEGYYGDGGTSRTNVPGWDLEWEPLGELVQGILEVGKRAGHSMCGGHVNGMFGFFFTEGPVCNFADAKKSDAAKFARFYWGMLEQGVYFAPSQFEAGFTSLAHTAEDIKMTISSS
ncbi:Pyridoxal phosphate-dependent transferase, major domain [Sesbania bispinosa]|nr:Pyridoxal phosphate-dependent transferase, major domain [Sesbania bispinosa]